MTDRPVDAVADSYVDEYAALSPNDATHLGISGYDHLLTDLSPDGFAERDALVRRTLAALGRTEPTDAREAVARDAMLERLGVEAEEYAAGLTQSGLNVIASPLQDLRMVFDQMDTSSPQGWDNVRARLDAVPETLDGYRETLRASADAGQVAARRQVLACAQQTAAWTEHSRPGGDFFTTLLATAPEGRGLSTDLRRAADRARQAFRTFGRFLTDELAPKASDRDAVGRERYQLASRSFLGATIDLDETYAWGWQELARIENEMVRAAEQIVPGGTVDDAVAALDADPARRIGSKEAFRDWMQQLADRAIDELADRHFDIPAPIRRIECRIAPTSDGGIYYTAPSEDFHRPGRMWWAVPEGVTSFATWQEVTTVFHEGVPGHHLQVAQNAHRTDLLNRWQRLMCFVSGHGEGWALYAERLMQDLGYLDDPGDLLGMLDAQAFRAVRVIIDIGMHLELEIPADNPFGFHPGERWTPELGFELLTQHCRIDEDFLRFELDRYLGWPGQAPSYKVGERIWLQARE
ncbi:MAG TPA: DUF885 domain-containing protein, partial [Nocardioidaceae bacterium]|nr:DUF885 domain-containing protein [Nocardioidaceae bacterium]